MKNRIYGRKTWAFAGGFIPVASNGREPEFVCKDIIAILNTTHQDATVKMTFYFTDAAPVGEYVVQVKAERLRRFHVNDLINPQAMPLGVAYGGVMESDVPVVVQLTKQDTSQQALALMGMTAFPADTN